MKEFFLLVIAVSAFVGLIFLQLRSMKKYHPNAELLIGVLRLINSDPEKK